jgi:hypothetical protein
MTDRSEREDRALDALIVSQLRRHDGDKGDIEHLPKLTDEESEALEGLGPDFIDRVIAGKVKTESDDSPAEEEGELLCAGGMAFGLNRAEEIDEETAEELDEKRKEIIERLKKEEEDGNADS